MRDPKWIGSSPSNVVWSADGKKLFFSWNPGNATADSLYYITEQNKIPVKATPAQKQQLLPANNVVHNKLKTAYAYAKDGDIFYTHIKSGKTQRIVSSFDIEFNPQFSFNDTKLVYTRSQNLYAWDINNGETIQLTRIQTGNKTVKEKTDTDNQQEKWLRQDQLQLFEILRQRKEKKKPQKATLKTCLKKKK